MKFVPLLLLPILFFARPCGAADPDFGREVLPILAKHCIVCHGPDPDARESDLRLDRQSDATADLGGYHAIKPGEPDASELITRITSDDDDVRMPPVDSAKKLSDTEIDILRRWIAAGAQYTEHWAFVPPVQPPVPDVEASNWCRGAIDKFTLKQMANADLTPTAPAHRANLIRRIYIDLVGINPTPEQVDAFLQDNDPQAYEHVVDRLLASPEYGERFARPWLDLARYADTNGYEKDRPRTVWPFRDWVINALAADIRYDQFSIEQLAGDMLPAATNDQRIATGFHRNTMLNEEGGIDPLEYRFYSVVDRVATTGTVWMGLTTGCAQCHTHKYDPITHTDYFSLFALLNNCDEPDVVVDDDAAVAQRTTILASIAEETKQLREKLLTPYGSEAEPTPINDAFNQWIAKHQQQSRTWESLRPTKMESTMPMLTIQDDLSVLGSGDVTKRDVYQLSFDIKNSDPPATALRLEALPHESLPAGGPGLAFYEGRRGDFFVSELKVSFRSEPVELTSPSHSFGTDGSGNADSKNVLDRDGSTGWSTPEQEGHANQIVVNFAKPLVGNGELNVELLFERHYAAALGRFRISLTSHPESSVATSLPASLADRFAGGDVLNNEKNYQEAQEFFIRTADVMKPHREQLDRLKERLPAPVRTLALHERPTEHGRITHRHQRGEYLQPKETVAAAVPSLFAPLDPDRPANRLELARWLVSEKNPLVGRVVVNRAWREFFGTGIVDTAGDFGTQSQPPSHPELLDWLAIDLRENGWSMKRLHRQIVTSSTYRQAVDHAPVNDPDNRLLSTFPHRRFDAEQIRDVMLSASGLLTRQVGGPSVHPPQPESVNAMAWGNAKWNASNGADRYRRSLYTFSKRTAPFAAFSTFDGPSGENCVPRRDRSTTPLQALTLMNDAMYVEIARGLAATAARDVPDSENIDQMVTQIFRRLFSRAPNEDERREIIAFYESQSTQEEPWMLVARALMNTDEAITTP